MFLNNHFSSYFKRHKGRAPVSPCVRRQAGAVQVGPVFLWEEGLQGGKATPNFVPQRLFTWDCHLCGRQG